MELTAGQILIDRALPPVMRGKYPVVDGKTIASIMQEVAEVNPEEYRTTLKKLMDIGQDVAYHTGGYSFGLQDLLPSPEAIGYRDGLRQQVKAILHDSKLEPKARNQKLIDLVMGSQDELVRQSYESGRKANNPLAMQVASGARGKPDNVKSLTLGEGLYADHHENAIPYAVLSGFAEGLRPADYFAGAFGNRKSLVDTKAGTANAGFYNKLLIRAAHRLVVTDDDDDDTPERGTNRGLPVDVDDADNIGALLAMPAAGYPRNTPITPAVLKDIKESGAKKLLVRSPIAFGSPDGGVYARDAGIREKGLPLRGDLVGISATQALGEPVTQSSLGSKHKGGSAAGGPSGFKYLQMLATAPEESPWWATHSQKAGVVQGIRPAPAGGFIVTVNGEDHTTSPDAVPTVKVGDSVDDGDELSNGLSNPNELVKFKGIGEGRRQYLRAMQGAFTANKIQANRRNVELMARGMINHVRMTDEHGDWLPDDVVPYDRVEAGWKPRPGTYAQPVDRSAGRYLEKPVLHYTIGTKLTKKMADEIGEFGIKNVDVHDTPPPFQPEFVSGSDTLLYDPDWQTRMLGSNQQKATLDAAWRGLSSDESGTSFVPSLAKGVGFGLSGKVSH